MSTFLEFTAFCSYKLLIILLKKFVFPFSVKERSPEFYSAIGEVTFVRIQIVRIIEEEKANHYRDLLKSKLRNFLIMIPSIIIHPAELSKGFLHRNPQKKKTVTIVMVQWDEKTKATKNITVEIIDSLATIKSEICEEVAEEKRDDKAKSKGKTKSSKK